MFMIVPDDVRKCVAFLGYQSTSGYRAAGTAFLVSRKPSGTDALCNYVITAKHVIEAIRKYSVDEKVVIRLNEKGAGYIAYLINCDAWWGHPSDKSVDVAITGFGWLPTLDHLSYPIERFATERIVTDRQIGVGQDLFLAGLFVNHYGNDRNIPIIRVGNIAAMPEERVSSRLGDIEAYLIEARSIGGLSGSPVFVMMGNATADQPRINRNASEIYLLGLMHGHFLARDFGVDCTADDTTAAAMNMGIAIVVPAKQILEVLDQQKVIDLEVEAVSRWRASKAK